MKFIRARTEELRRESRAAEREEKGSATEEKTLRVKLMSL